MNAFFILNINCFQDTFIVDNGEAGIWVWCGRKASPAEKREAMVNAMVYIISSTSSYLLHPLIPYRN